MFSVGGQNDDGGMANLGLDGNVLQEVVEVNALGGFRRSRQHEKSDA